MKRNLAVLLLLAVVAVLFAAPQNVSAQKPTPSQAAPEEPQPPPPAAQEKEKVKGYTLPPEQYQKAVEYSRARYQLYFIGFAYGLLILWLVLKLKWSARWRDWAERASRVRFVQALVYVPILSLVTAVLGLPTDLYGQWLSLKYDQSVQGWGSWFWDWTKSQFIGIVLSVVLLWILYWVIRRSPRRWWFHFWLAALPILLFVFFIAPFVITPLFFKFEPLEKTNPQLVTEIEKVVQRGGLTIPRERMFEMKASEKLKSVNAYVTGFGASKRVVVWDTTIQKTTVPETLFVFGHEMGHYVLGHVWEGIAFFAVVLLVFLYLGYRGLHWMLGRWGAGWGLRGVDDWASLPVLLLLLSVFGFLFSPIASSYSRYQEHQADIYGLEVIHGLVPDSQQAAARAFQILGEINLADPEPSTFIKIWLYSHPPLKERIEFALTYDPWSKGERPKYIP
ncbi:MAG TPA: M48 family metallopeptidase [Candidatus Xenobia bacterium]|nr:M48 family metallopeptidase [Candidatus Xenobia bacterium]